jgi:hypothetical protein
MKEHFNEKFINRLFKGVIVMLTIICFGIMILVGTLIYKVILEL